MTGVAFHFNVPDRLAYACRLLRKAVASGARLVVTGSESELQRLDGELWTFSATDFVPHCHIHADPALVESSPVILSPSTEGSPHAQVLVNLGRSVPKGFERFERVIELVGLDEDERQVARGRWKHYSDHGYAITRHDLALRVSD